MSKNFVHFWPLITDKKKAKERANWVIKPINKYHEKSRKILELGVGIGEVLVNFPKRFDIYGLDHTKQYIDYCKKKIIRGHFFVSSMHDFKHKEKFDVIFSVYDSVCFLKNFDQWKQTFRNVSKHLNKNGLFVFDTYTPKILKDFKNKKESKSKFSKGYITDKAIIKNNTLTWDFKVFEKIRKSKYQVNKYKFKETIYPVQKVKSALTQHFKILETKLMDNNRRILFICRKK